jgi:hypothetical protein
VDTVEIKLQRAKETDFQPEIFNSIKNQNELNGDKKSQIGDSSRLNEPMQLIISSMISKKERLK